MMTCSISESLEQEEGPEGGEGIWTEPAPQPFRASAASSAAAAVVPSLSSSRRFMDAFAEPRRLGCLTGREGGTESWWLELRAGHDHKDVNLFLPVFRRCFLRWNTLLHAPF